MKPLFTLVTITLVYFSFSSAVAKQSMNEENVHKWAIDKVEKILSYSPETEIETKLETLSPYFTEEGYKSFLKAQKQARLYSYYNENEENLEAVYKKDTDIDEMAYQDDIWIADIPVVFVQANDIFKNKKFYITLKIKELANSKNSLGITQFIMSDVYTSPECDERSVKTAKIFKEKMKDMSKAEKFILIKRAEKNPNIIKELLNEKDLKIINSYSCDEK